MCVGVCAGVCVCECVCVCVWGYLSRLDYVMECHVCMSALNNLCSMFSLLQYIFVGRWIQI